MMFKRKYYIFVPEESSFQKYIIEMTVHSFCKEKNELQIYETLKLIQKTRELDVHCCFY